MTTKQAGSAKSAKAGAPNETIALLQKLAANKKKRNAAREAELQQRAAFLESEQRAAEKDVTAAATTTTLLGTRRPVRADTTLTDISALQEKLGLGGSSSGYLDTEKILHAAEPAEPTSDVDANIAAAIKEALTSLGLYNSTLIAYFQDEDRIMASEVFRNAVISGVVATQAIKKKHCSDETALALFTLLAFSSDGELAGAAFRSLLCMLGEDTIHNGTGVDAGYGYYTGTDRDTASSSLELSVKAVPTAAAILQALEQNGYMPAGNSGNKSQRKGNGKDRAEELNEEEEGKEQVQNENTLRVYSIMLLLHISVAVCNHCTRKPEAAKKALSPSDVSNLLIAVMYMGLDAAAVRLQPNLDAACIALLGAFTDDDWNRQLPLLSRRISEMGKSSRSRLRLLRQLPVDDRSVRYRVRQLQRFAGCILVEKILPANLNSSSSAIPSRGLIGAPDPTDILLSQPWFRNPKAVVSAAISPSSVTEKTPPPAYMTTDVELLLHLCDLLLWPSALRAVKDRYVASCAASPSPVKQDSMRMITAPEDDEGMLDADGNTGTTNAEKEPKLSADFLAAWSTFLTGIVKNIRTLQPEEMAVKTLASRLEFKYKETVEKPLWALSP